MHHLRAIAWTKNDIVNEQFDLYIKSADGMAFRHSPASYIEISELPCVVYQFVHQRESA